AGGVFAARPPEIRQASNPVASREAGSDEPGIISRPKQMALTGQAGPRAAARSRAHDRGVGMSGHEAEPGSHPSAPWPRRCRSGADRHSRTGRSVAAGLGFAARNGIAEHVTTAPDGLDAVL